MKKLLKAACMVTLASAITVPGVPGNSQSIEDIQRLFPGVVADGVVAYIYGYPLMMFGVTGIPIRTQLGLDSTQFGILTATPVLTGALFRLPLGIWTDRFGGRIRIDLRKLRL